MVLYIGNHFDKIYLVWTKEKTLPQKICNRIAGFHLRRTVIQLLAFQASTHVVSVFCDFSKISLTIE